MGFLDLQSGDGPWNILIRTLEAQGQEDGSWRAVVKAGGGLTIGSDPADEVEEAKLKVGPKNAALPQTLATYCNYIILYYT